MKFIILSLLLLTSCGPTNQQPIFNVDAPYLPYLYDFLEEASKQNVLVDISGLQILTVPTIPPITGGIVNGLCWMQSKLIHINEEQWNKNIGCHKDLIYHELGHCLLHRYHLDHHYMVVADSTVPATIMASVGLPCSRRVLNDITYLDKHYGDYFAHELFHPQE
jgi:hypothetical protein